MFTGIQEGVWLALVTTTTVGYGDFSPRSAFGRGVMAVWMFIGFVAMAGVLGMYSICVTIIDSPDNHALNISPTSMRTCSPPTDGTLILHACIAIICMHIRRYC